MAESKPEIKKRDYPLRRGSTYYIEMGEKALEYPSVTSILGDTLPKKQLISWAARTAAAFALANPWVSVEEAANSIYKKRDSAADLGKTVHSWAEAYGNGAKLDIADAPEELKPYFHAFLSFIKDQNPKILHTEATVFNVDHEYAGTADQIAELHTGDLAIFDYKTGKGTYYESHLQQVAYANATHLLTKDRKIIEMPKISKMFLVHLKDNGKYNLIEVDEPFEDFLHVKKMWSILKRQEASR
jgi:hypothetical protein